MPNKYPNALYKDGRRVNINDVRIEDRGRFNFSCLSCHEEMTFALTEKRRYFRHFTKHECSGASYIHNLAEFIIQEEGKVMLPAYKEIPSKQVALTDVKREVFD